MEEINEKLDKIISMLSERSKLVVTQEITNDIPTMDFTKVTIMGQTEKSLLVVKEGYQQFLARQFIYNPEEEYIDGRVYSIILKEKSDQDKPTAWVKSKWTPFVPFKGGKN